jgi:hypothetical protein
MMLTVYVGFNIFHSDVYSGIMNELKGSQKVQLLYEACSILRAV